MVLSDFDQVGSFWWTWGIGLGGLLIFTSSVAASYAFARRFFYHRGGPRVWRLLLHFCPQLEKYFAK